MPSLARFDDLSRQNKIERLAAWQRGRPERSGEAQLSAGKQTLGATDSIVAL